MMKLLLCFVLLVDLAFSAFAISITIRSDRLVAKGNVTKALFVPSYQEWSALMKPEGWEVLRKTWSEVVATNKMFKDATIKAARGIGGFGIIATFVGLLNAVALATCLYTQRTTVKLSASHVT